MEKIDAIIDKRIKEADGKLKLHLGCGFEKWDGYVNIDICQEISNPDILADASDLCFIKSNTVDVIESYHLVEHIGHQKILKVLMEWRRCLKDGGELIFETPNLGPMLEAFCKIRSHSGDVNGDFGPGSIYNSIYGGQNDVGNYHLGCYTIGTILMLLRMAGFKDYKIRREFPLHGIEYGSEWNIRLVATK